MSGINFLSDNLLDTATLSITTGSANAQFPLDNLKDDTTTRKFRSVGNTVVILIDLLMTRDLNSFGVVGDSTDTFGLTDISIKTSVTTDFSSSPNIPITISAKHNIGYEFFTEVNHRYVQVTMTGTGSFAEASKFFIGARINLPENSLSVPSFRYRHIDLSTFRRNEYGQKFINVRNKIKAIGGTLQHCTLTEHELIDDMYIEHGKSTPLWMIVDPDSDAMNDGRSKLALYGYFNRTPRWTATGAQLWTSNLLMEQVV